ncbi:MAG: AzlD domain-containing protein [Gammaproteobacteria bacterium]|uniref:AzlD domain-containing protein n=1 Tax=Pseudacidovorax sp. 1753 TaxID=3156419 RepID=UPI0033976B9C
MMQTDPWTVAIILGLAVVTVVTRCFFFISERSLPLPAWVHRALRYAPVAALAAVVAPEVVMSGGHLVPSWQDARLFAAAVGAALYFWRRSTLITMAGGMAVYLPLHLGLGW